MVSLSVFTRLLFPRLCISAARIQRRFAFAPERRTVRRSLPEIISRPRPLISAPDIRHSISRAQFYLLQILQCQPTVRPYNSPLGLSLCIFVCLPFPPVNLYCPGRSASCPSASATCVSTHYLPPVNHCVDPHPHIRAPTHYVPGYPLRRPRVVSVLPPERRAVCCPLPEANIAPAHSYLRLPC